MALPERSEGEVESRHVVSDRAWRSHAKIFLGCLLLFAGSEKPASGAGQRASRVFGVGYL